MILSRPSQSARGRQALQVHPEPADNCSALGCVGCKRLRPWWIAADDPGLSVRIDSMAGLRPTRLPWQQCHRFLGRRPATITTIGLPVEPRLVWSQRSAGKPVGLLSFAHNCRGDKWDESNINRYEALKSGRFPSSASQRDPPSRGVCLLCL